MMGTRQLGTPGEAGGAIALPDLLGTAEHVRGAEPVRAALLAACRKHVADWGRLLATYEARGRDTDGQRDEWRMAAGALGRLEGVREARWWIRHRECLLFPVRLTSTPQASAANRSVTFPAPSVRHWVVPW